MANTKRECPLKWWVAEGYAEAFAAPCTRELCQWWLGNAEQGNCAITFTGLALAEANGYRFTADTPDPEPDDRRCSNCAHEPQPTQFCEAGECYPPNHDESVCSKWEHAEPEPRAQVHDDGTCSVDGEPIASIGPEPSAPITPDEWATLPAAAPQEADAQ